MSTTYPSSKQTFTDPAATDPLNAPSHSELHTNKGDTLEALQDRMGYGSDGTPSAANRVLRSSSGTATAWVLNDTLFSTLGTLILTDDGSNLTLTGSPTGTFSFAGNSAYSFGAQVLVPTSSAGAPRYAFSGDTNTGMRGDGADGVIFISGGTDRLTISNVITPTVQIRATVATASAPAYSFTGDVNTGIDALIADELHFITTGTTRATVGTATFESRLVFLAPRGITTTSVGFSFAGDTNTGIGASSLTADQVNLIAGGTRIASFNTDAFYVVAGSVSLPGYSFIGDQDTGLRRSAADTLALVTGGADRLTIDGSVVSSTVRLVPSSDVALDVGSPTLRWLTVYATGLNSQATLFLGTTIVADGAAAESYEWKWDGNVATPTNLAAHTKWSFQDNVDADKDFLFLRYSTISVGGAIGWIFNNPNSGSGVGGGGMGMLAGGTSKTTATAAMLLIPYALSGAIEFSVAGNSALTIRQSGQQFSMGSGFILNAANKLLMSATTRNVLSGSFMIGYQDGGTNTSNFHTAFYDGTMPGVDNQDTGRVVGIFYDGGIYVGKPGRAAVVPTQPTQGIRATGYVAVSTASNQAGANLVLGGGPNTGNSVAAGGILFQTADATGSGTAVQTLVTKLSLLQSLLTFTDAVNIAVGTPTGTQIATAADQKLAFWGATPAAQPSSTGETTGYTGGGGTALTHSDTFTGNSGTKAYTINDIVKHLKAAGLLAAS